MANKKLFQSAYDFLKKDNFIGIYLAFDIGEEIVCFGGNPDVSFYGCRSVAVSKKTKECKWFIESDGDNENKLDNAIKIEIPSEYIYKF